MIYRKTMRNFVGQWYHVKQWQKFCTETLKKAEAARAISSFWKTHSCKLIPNWTGNRMITYTNWITRPERSINYFRIFCVIKLDYWNWTTWLYCELRSDDLTIEGFDCIPSWTTQSSFVQKSIRLLQIIIFVFTVCWLLHVNECLLCVFPCSFILQSNRDSWAGLSVNGLDTSR